MRRITLVALLTVALALTGLVGPAPATADPIPPTSHGRLDGLPGATATTGLREPRPGPEGATRVEQMAAAGATLSAQVRTPMRFTTVGFMPPADTEVGFRTSADGAEWTDWLWAPTLREDDGPEPGSAEAEAALGVPASEAYWVGDAGWLQIRVLGAGAPEQVRVELIDTLGVSRSLLQRAGDALAAAWRPQPPAHATVATPGIVSRAEWGADESLRGHSPTYAERMRAGVIHHTAGGNGYSASEAPAVVRGVYAYHTRSQGWSDVGYNILIDRYGTVYEGRHGGLERAVVGAHAGGFNTGTFGVSILGEFGAAAPPQEALDALVEVLAWKLDVHHLDVEGTVKLTSGGSTRYSKGTDVTLPVLFAHRDVSATACPGDAFYRQLPDIRQQVSAAASDMFLEPDVTPAAVTVIDGASVDGAVTLSARLRPAGVWAAEVRDPDGALVLADAGRGSVARVVWQPTGVRHGTHTMTLTAPGRRTVTRTVELRRPEIRNAAAAPELLEYGRDGRLSADVGISADLWQDARWTVTLEGPTGRALSRSGTGARAEASWSGPAPAPGTYRWEIEAHDADPVAGEITVLRNLLGRVAGQGGAVTGPVAVSQTAFSAPGRATRAVVARDDVFADAMAGGPLAGTEGPVLLTGGDELDGRVRSELERVLAPDATVYVLGGVEALAPAVEDSLAERWTVIRLAGRGRVETAAAVAAEVLAESGATTALVARAGPDDRSPWADALSGGAYGASRGIPVLLTDTDRLSAGTRAALRDLGIADTIVLGGSAAVGDAVLDELPRPRRVFGSDRAGTAAAVARSLWGRESGTAEDAFVLTGGYEAGAWRLALAASPLAARERAPLLLAEASAVPAATRDYLTALGYGPGTEAGGWVLGSEDDVDESVRAAVSAVMQ